MRNFLGIVTVIVFILGQPGLSAAQEQDMDLGTIVVTAGRLAQEGASVSPDVSVIGAGDIRRSGAVTVGEILAQQGGVVVSEPGASLKTATVDIRGFGDTAKSNVLFLVNGRKMNSIDLSGTDLLQVPLAAVEKIEIIRGAGSVLYGDNAVGGVINIITKKGQGPATAVVGVSQGSYNTTNTDLQVSGSRERLSYSLYSQYFDTHGYRSNSGLLAKDFVSSLGYEFSEDFSLQLDTSWHEDDYGMPGGLNDAELALLGRRGSADEQNYGSTKDRMVQLTTGFAPRALGLTAGRAIVDVTCRNRDTYAMLSSEYGDWATKRGIDTVGVNGRYVLESLKDDVPVDAVLGFDFYNVNNDILGSEGNTDNLTISKEEFGSYLSLEWEFVDSLFLKAGTRYQLAEYTIDDKGAGPYVEQKPDENVSLLGLRYAYAPEASVAATVQQTFRFPATDEFYSSYSGLNTDLDPQSGIQYELGVKHPLSKRVRVEATGYVMDIKDEIYLDPITFFNKNYEQTRRVGLDLGPRLDLTGLWLDAELVTHWDVFLNYNYENPFFKGGENDGKRIPWVPLYQASAGSNITLWDLWGVSLTGRYIGARYKINDLQNESSVAKPYVLFDGKVSFRKDPLEIFFSVNNIFDEKYFTYVAKGTSTTDFYPAPERNFRAGMKLRF